MKNVPSSVYRLQLNEKFTLKQATKLLPYLKELGVEGVYCSPYFAAYSPHGYDIVDPNRLNPQVATPKDFNAFCKKLKQLKLFHIADIVPNHMGIKGDNRWWQDILEHGKDSPYASYFDIDWEKKKINIAILGVPHDQAEIKTVKKGNKRYYQHGDQLFPYNTDHYQLVHWLSFAQEPSYRRFFNINELVGVRIEDKKVLEAHHKWIFELLKTKKVDGLRVDHPDGLYDPKTYFDSLRKKHKGLIVVEKILGWKEELPPNWQVEGTVGYEYLNMLTGLFVKPSNKLTKVYSRFIGKETDFDELLYEKKKFYMATEMAGDVKNLAAKLPLEKDLTKGDLVLGIYQLLACFPVYRSYIRPKGIVPKRDIPYLEEAFRNARKQSRELGSRVFDYLEEIFFLKKDTPVLRDFLMRFQQLSAPIMAKGFEDITLYNYNRLLALNEVGSEPCHFGITADEFHQFCKRKQEKWPLGFLATSTHDTKRSMDVRMQLAVLSEIPEKWEKALKTWSKLNQKHKTNTLPDANAEYFLYQILLGAWPSRPSFARMWESFQKSIREARTYTSWRHPDPAYETACKNFLKAILKKESPFRRSFEKFQREIAEYGQWNSLSALILKLGGPGIIDIYQGCENWRYSLVDPDNRRPVDYSRPETLKVELHRRALNFRRKHKALFLEGKYIPLEIKGPKKAHIIAYLRTHGKKACLVAGVRFPTTAKTLKGTQILLPKKQGRGVDLFSQKPIEGRTLPAEKLFANAPFAWVIFDR